MKGENQDLAAAAAGMSTRTGQRWESRPLLSQREAKRTWRTRADLFTEVWDDEVVVLLRADKERMLQAKTVLKE